MVIVAALTLAGGATAIVTSNRGATENANQNQHVAILYALIGGSGTLVPAKGGLPTLTLTITSVGSNITWFTDRPARDSGILPLGGFVRSWDSYGFNKVPPNVALVVRTANGRADTVIASMSRPRIYGDNLQSDLTVLKVTEAKSLTGHLQSHAKRYDSDFPNQFVSSSLFIDDVNGTYIDNCLIAPFTYCVYSDFTGLDLSGANLSNAGFNAVSFKNTNLTGANLSNVNIWDSEGSGVILNGANLTGAVQIDFTDILGYYYLFVQSDSTTICWQGSMGPCWTDPN